MRAMRTLAMLFICFSFCFQGTVSTVPGEASVDHLMASAAEAAIGAPPQQITISDHYGDPDGFMKYIIRKPPVLA